MQDEFADRWVLEAFQPVGITNSGQLIRLIKLDLHQGREARALSAVRRRMLACCVVPVTGLTVAKVAFPGPWNKPFFLMD